MRIMDSICQSSGRKTSTDRLINEDGLLNFTVNYKGEQYSFTVLMDGSTGLGKYYEIKKGLTPAEWYVEFMLSQIKNICMKKPTSHLKEVVEEAVLNSINEINKYSLENNLTLEEYQKPSAGLCLLRANSKTTEIFLLGDTETIIAYKDGNIDNIDNPNQKILQELDNMVLSKMSEIAKQNNCDVLDVRSNPIIESMLQVNRSKKNSVCKNGYWICGTTPNATNHGITISFDNSTLDGIILATDGFDYRIIEKNEKDIYSLIKTDGINNITLKIRSAEELDSTCNKFPRFKKSDDLTVIFLDYCSN